MNNNRFNEIKSEEKSMQSLFSKKKVIEIFA